VATESSESSEPFVNLLSDTQTRPTAGMRRAMAEAEVGDEQLFADPTVNALVERVAALLGQESAVYLPTGTMCNQIAIRVHVRPDGEEILLDRTSHPLTFEGGGPAALSGAVMRPLEGDRGVFTAAQLEAALADRAPMPRYPPRPRLVVVEQSTNMGGGRVWPSGTVGEVLGVARTHGLRTHLDGARLMNAVVASGVAADRWAGGFDTAWIDFTKGLGAPVGAVMAGSRELIEQVWRYKQMLGGAMRQAGIVAAGCLYALDHHVERLADDHANARVLAEGLAEVPGVVIDPATVETNIVFFEVADAPAFCAALADRGVGMVAMGERRIRAVTHLDVDREGIDRALTAVSAVRAGR
jgi:threonine aldolase